MSERAQRVVEKAARAIARDINQHQLDTGFAADFDFPNGLDQDFASYSTTARAALRAALTELRSLHTDSTVDLDEWIEELTGG